MVVVICWQLGLLQHAPFQQIVHDTPLCRGAVMPGKQITDSGRIQIGIEDRHSFTDTGEIKRGGRERR